MSKTGTSQVLSWSRLYRQGSFPTIFVYSTLSWSILYHSTRHRSWQVNDVLVPVWILPGIVCWANALQKQQQHPRMICLRKKNGEKCSTVEHLDQFSFLSMGNCCIPQLPVHYFHCICCFFSKFAIINQSGMMARIKNWGKFKRKTVNVCFTENYLGRVAANDCRHKPLLAFL